MSSKRRHDSECLDGGEAEHALPDVVKKAKAEKNGNGVSSPAPPAAGPAEPMESAAADVKVAELTNETITVEWSASAVGESFAVTLKENSNANTQSKDVKSGDDKTCSVEFKNLKPLTKYTLKISSSKSELSSLETQTPPSLELPEIEEVQEKCAHLTLAPLPEDEAKNVEGYLLLVRPLEDAKDYPAAEIKDSNLKTKLESLVKPPFYIAYEFTQDELAEENGGQVQVGSGAQKKDGRYGAVQDPKLTSGGNYRVVLVVIMNLEGKQTLFKQESFQMLVK